MALPHKFGTPMMQVGGGASFPNAASVTPSDGTALSPLAAALWVGGAGSVTVVTYEGQTVTFNAVAAGTLLPISCQYVKATGTTATLIVALW